MNPRHLARTAVVVFLVAGLIVACGGRAEEGAPAGAARPSHPVSSGPTGWYLLTVTDDGLALVPEGSGTPVWSLHGAVAAPDGSTAFAARPSPSSPAATELAALNRLSGEPMKAWTLDGHLDVAAVAPDARLVALTENGPERTTVVVYAPQEERELHRHVLDGVIHPEAFTLDGRSLFVIHDLIDRPPIYQYMVELMDLEGEHPNQTSRLTLIGTKMEGTALGAVLSPAGRYLSTLYRLPPHGGHGDAPAAVHPAFVHIADLQTGTARCVDLPPPFGTGAVGEDRIAGDDSSVIVTSVGGRKRARLALPAPPPGETPAPDVVDATAADSLAAGVTSVPGFRYVVQTLR